MWPAPFADFSSAAPWVGGGFVTGLLTYALVRALLGIDRRRIARLNALTTILDESRSAASELADSKTRLENQLSQAEQRAALSGRLEQEVVQLRNIEGTRQSSLSQAATQIAALRDGSASQIAALRDEIETQRSTAQYFEDEFGRLSAKYEELSKTTYRQTSELARLQSAAEGSAAAPLPAMPEGVDRELYESEVATLLSTAHDLRSDLAASEHRLKDCEAQIAAMPAVVSNYQKFKDVLEAANRIASGLPAKAGA